MKKNYSSPTVSVVKIRMEADIAVGSARIYPHGPNDQVQEEWIEDTDETKNIDW